MELFSQTFDDSPAKAVIDQGNDFFNVEPNLTDVLPLPVPKINNIDEIQAREAPSAWRYSGRRRRRSSSIF